MLAANLPPVDVQSQLGHRLLGSLSVELIELSDLDEELVVFLACAVGPVEKRTGPKLSTSKINERFFFPVTCDLVAAGGALHIELWAQGAPEKKLGNIDGLLSKYMQTEGPNDCWVPFESRARLHAVVRFSAILSDAPVDSARNESKWRCKPLRTKDLQEMYGDLSINEVYIHHCHNYSLKKYNSVVLQSLPNVPSISATLQTLSMSNLMLGDKGVIPVLESCRLIRTLKSLALDSNDMSNQAAAAVLRTLRHHPSLSSLSVCDNPFCEAAGEKLLMLLKANRNILSLKVWNNKFSAYILKRLAQQQDRNSKLLEEHTQEQRQKKSEFVAKGIAMVRLQKLDARTAQLVEQTWVMICQSSEAKGRFSAAFGHGARAALDNVDYGIDEAIARILKFFGAVPAPELYGPDERPASDKVLERVLEGGTPANAFLFLVRDAVASLHNWGQYDKKLKLEGNAYYAVGVRLVHYDLMEPVFLAAIEKGLAGAFNEELFACWQRLYVLLTRSMTETVPDSYDYARA